VEQLEQKLGRDVANLSVLGYSPQQEQRMLVRYGLPLKPKLVLWIFFANDLKDAWRFQQFGSGAMKESPFWQNPIKSWLAQHSAVYITFSFFWYNRSFFYRLSQAEKGVSPGIAWWLANIDPAVPEVAQGLELTGATILEARRQAQAEGSQFVVVVLPFREQVYEAPALQSQFDGPIGRLTELLQAQEVTVIDLTGEMRARAGQESQPLYFASDIHLNERGNEIVAELLAQKLQNILKQLQP
jgi:lysophospholipase L1-like esterase